MTRPSSRREIDYPSDSDVSFSDVNPVALFLLGRRLMQIAEGVLPEGSAATSVRLVLIDVAYHPNSSITEITERTGFPQSLVSTAVARLREVGVVESGPDPLDRRRTLVRTTPALETVGRRFDEVSISDALARELAVEDQDQVTAAVAALELLARLLTPEVLDDDTETLPGGGAE
jgi:DNA-binding MarR family transcriptional regulator